MYADINFKTKKALRDAITAGREVYVFSPGPWPAPQNGDVSISGPHYPAPHTWYARVRVQDGRIVKVAR
jgi:hypothetical protein